MDQNIITIISDCDGTLCPDTSDNLVRHLRLDSREFWKGVSELVAAGWDPPLAYLNGLLAKGITRQILREVAQSVEFYPGVPDFLERLRRGLDDNPDYRNAGVAVEWYIVSGGIEELLRATRVAPRANDIFACELDYDAQGRATAIKRTVTFTEKTKFIFAINKGIAGAELRRAPYKVNDAVVPDGRRVPFQHMVYIGDGPSDVPCFSMIKSMGGHAIGVMPPGERDLEKPYELAQGQRLTVGPYTADYSDGTDLMKMLWRIVEGIANSIVEKRAHRTRPSPHP